MTDRLPTTRTSTGHNSTTGAPQRPPPQLAHTSTTTATPQPPSPHCRCSPQSRPHRPSNRGPDPYLNKHLGWEGFIQLLKEIEPERFQEPEGEEVVIT
ncbi:hypothetical protein R6Q59_021920 [Mikania micrantha]